MKSLQQFLFSFSVARWNLTTEWFLNTQNEISKRICLHLEQIAETVRYQREIIANSNEVCCLLWTEINCCSKQDIACGQHPVQFCVILPFEWLTWGSFRTLISFLANNTYTLYYYYYSTANTQTHIPTGENNLF